MRPTRPQAENNQPTAEKIEIAPAAPIEPLPETVARIEQRPAPQASQVEPLKVEPVKTKNVFTLPFAALLACVALIGGYVVFSSSQTITPAPPSPTVSPGFRFVSGCHRRCAAQPAAVISRLRCFSDDA